MTDEGGIHAAAADVSASATPATWPAGWSVERVAQTGSTNEDLLRRVAAGDGRDRHVLVTDHQTAGRGRLDRRWDAPPGRNLLASALFVDAQDPSLLTSRIGLAIVDAVERLVPTVAADPDRIGLKWPNDVLLDGAKLAGVLAQRSAQTGAVVVGFGVNLGWAPDGAIALEAVTSSSPSPLRLLATVLERFDAQPTGDALRDEYRARLLTIGRDVRIELPGGATVVGRALDVSGDGRLVVDDGRERHELDVGDVVHLRTADR